MIDRIRAFARAHRAVVMGVAGGLVAAVTAIWPGLPGQQILGALSALLGAA